MSMSQIEGIVRPSTWRPLRLQTSVNLRWMAVTGQTIAVLFVAYGLGYPMAVYECLVAIACSVAVNIWLILRYGGSYRPSPSFSASLNVFDLWQLGALLALTGGIENPFSLLLLAPVSVAATTLSQRLTISIALMTAAITSAIAIFHLPLPWDPNSRLEFSRAYLVGAWVAVICGLAFISTYVNRVAHEAREISDALAATELALARKEQLSALDGLAAAAAHELGTPLSTIALAAKEMRADAEPGSDLAGDVELIIEQAARCRAILAKLRNLNSSGEDPFAAVPVTDLLSEVTRPHEGRGKAILFYYDDAVGDPPIVPRNVGLLYGLGNILENATDFARSTVRVEAKWDSVTLTVTVTDDGPGFAPELVSRLGEPYLTSRVRDPNGPDASKPGGLGLGVFIAKTLLERSGAKVGFSNASEDGHARVRISWPRSAVEQQFG
jgi:two-component system sensor histidine kinase RegB